MEQPGLFGQKYSPHCKEVEQAVLRVASDMHKFQHPLIIQPVWNTEKGRMRLADDCLDVFVWSNFAVLKMCVQEGEVSDTDISTDLFD